MLEIKNAMTQMNTFDRFIRILDTVKERNRELENISVETNQSERQREKKLKTIPEFPRIMGQLQKVQNTQNQSSRTKKRERSKRYILRIDD